ncbi:C-type lectin protein [Colletotrichum navitas]|uniref:C-type lectin protein n=1 Tax=Colletotrichum navitas TaxID=681940 RepID=A0AAD8PL19_9PEZI|nr:C-type lectin protein [Colletotrichum navitas]KAK1569699.1 C-type lectin protein [Colletotrichum navitas]
MLELHRGPAVARHLGPAPSEAMIATGFAAKNPALFALALQTRHCGDRAEDLLDSWLLVSFQRPGPVQELVEAAYNRICHVRAPRETVELRSVAAINDPAIDCTAVQHLLAARRLAGLPLHVAVELFRLHPQAYAPVVQSSLPRLASSGCSDGLIEGLFDGSPTQSQRGALLVADVVGKAHWFQDKIISTMLEIITQGTLSATDREKAGRMLSRFGDPRDLASLAEIPAGSFVMGSESHPDSQPLGEITLQSFRIGIYPVAVRDYSAFVRETGRDWMSQDGAGPDRLNTPATDLTWHGARAYCSWLTQHWRKIGKIGSQNKSAFRQNRSRNVQLEVAKLKPRVRRWFYPWGTTWEDQAANSETTCLDATCAVGLFPKGRSPYGCFDMAGQVREWCSTLWG